jgi:thiol-disulfide isomerase/thioredoxin
MSFKVTGIEVDHDLPTETFKPPADFDLVDTLGEQSAPARDDQLTLIGKPAPAFAGDGLDGKAVRLEDFRGRVVVLDFWATWCPPCVAAIPHVQKLSERFAEKPVTVLGINQDRGDTEKVAAFVKDNKVTFRHLMDEGEVGTSYLVSGIPCTVLIDKEGVVQDVSTGFAPEQEDELASKIELLLEGKPLRTEEELARIRETMEAKRNRPALAFSPENPERLGVSAFKARGFYSRHMSWTASIEGDIATELITPGHDNSVEIIDSSGESVRTVRFKGLSRRGRVESLAALKLNGDRHWLVGYSTLERGGGGSTVIGLYTDAGEEIWTFEPDVPEDSFVQSCVAAGDLTGDQEPEMVVGLSATRSRGPGAGLEFGAGNQAGAIIVLSSDGKVVSQRATKQVDLVFVGRPTEPGKPGPLLVSIAGRLHRVNLKAEARDHPNP